MSGLIVRSLLSVLVLPGIVVIVLPAWIVTSLADADVRWTHDVAVPGGMIIGSALFLLGFAPVAWCVTLFARVGKGTLAPWDPTKELVVRGPYRHVRNPMISGVAGMLLGEALFFGSAILAGWFLLFVLINHTYFILSEEPSLERRFGIAYADYRRRVPRWLPRRKGSVMMKHAATSDDRQFCSHFESGGIDPAAFNHRAHVRLAYVYLVEYGADGAADRMRTSLIGFLERNGIDTSKYHETITTSWILAVRHFMEKSAPAASADAFIDANAPLLDTTIMMTHYSAGVLFSPDARARFVEPDLDAIPRYDAQ